MEAGEAGQLQRSVQRSPCLSFGAQAPQWQLSAGREEASEAAPRSDTHRWRAGEITETQTTQDKGSATG